MKSTSKAVHKTHVKAEDKEVTTLFGKIRKGSAVHDVLKRSHIIAQLRQKGIRPEKIAAKTGYTQGQIYNMGLPAKWPKKIQNHISGGHIDVSEVLKLSRNQSTDANFIAAVENHIKAKNKNNNNTEIPIIALPKREQQVKNLVKRIYGDSLSTRNFNFAMDVIGRLAR